MNMLSQAKAFALLGKYYLDVEVDKQKARKCFQRALELDPAQVSVLEYTSGADLYLDTIHHCIQLNISSLCVLYHIKDQEVLNVSPELLHKLTQFLKHKTISLSH